MLFDLSLEVCLQDSTVFLVETIFTQCRIAMASLKIVKKVQKVVQRPNGNFVENLHLKIYIQIFIPIPRYELLL